MKKTPAHILPLIILSQFAGTSLWFVGNAILPDIQRYLNVQSTPGNITSIVQLGFITGTLVFAIFTVADRFSASGTFFISCLIAAVANVSIIWAASGTSLFILRFITGFFLAGIYPVGMKIAADWYEKGLGKALGYLVGALVLGTAFPHLLRSNLYALQWKQVLIFTSCFAFIGGLLILFFVGDGPYRKAGSHFHPSAIFEVFRSADFRSAALGYFGHMWELYTFWAFVPIMLQLYTSNRHDLNVPLWSFTVIAIGAFTCVAGGYISQRIGSGRVAFYALLTSALCCAISFSFFQLPPAAFILVMLLWGAMVIADSPQFSTLVAQTAIPQYRGTALTIVTSIGFAITIGSVELITYVLDNWKKTNSIFILLAPGPIIGLIFLFRLAKEKK